MQGYLPSVRRVVLMVENSDGSRQFADFRNLISGVTISQDTEFYRDFSGNPLRSVQSGPVEVTFEIPNYGGWTLYDVPAGWEPPAAPARELTELPRQLEEEHRHD